MHNDGNVVPLRKVATDQANHSPLARLPVILLQVRDKAAQQLRHGLQDLFDNADDTLFEMADRARDDVEQNLFFEAMRDLRLKRKNIERGFLEQFFESFAGLTQYELPHSGMPGTFPYVTSGALPQDELERNLAVEAMVSRVLNRDSFALDQLTARLSALLGKALAEHHNPMSPGKLCEYFLLAGRNLGVGIKVKLIILKLFERYVLSDCDQLYAEANQLLVITGVLPELKAAPARRASERAAVSVAPAVEVSAPAQPISTRDLLRLLSHLQQHVPAQASQDEFDLRNQLQQLLTRVSAKSGKSRVVGVANEDVINLIAMLFECILNDRHLPASLKSLIGRLQIPMLKVAVQDKSLFSHRHHPARRLLNEIATAALGWGELDDHQRKRLYLRIEQVVQRLLNEFVDDQAIFTKLLADFLAFTTDGHRRMEVLEQRTRDAAEGRTPVDSPSGLDDTLLFDRALASVLGNLRRLKRGK